MVLCKRYDKQKCFAGCVHNRPHEPIYDLYITTKRDIPTTCEKVASHCGYRDLKRTKCHKI